VGSTTITPIEHKISVFEIFIRTNENDLQLGSREKVCNTDLKAIHFWFRYKATKKA